MRNWVFVNYTQVIAVSCIIKQLYSRTNWHPNYVNSLSNILHRTMLCWTVYDEKKMFLNFGIQEGVCSQFIFFLLFISFHVKGGHIIGKTSCENLCVSGSSFTSHSGPTLNFHNPLHSAGGSSSGSATLVKVLILQNNNIINSISRTVHRFHGSHQWKQPDLK